MKETYSVLKIARFLKAVTLSMLMTLICANAYAQSTVTGVVSDEEGQPIAGVAVIVHGTNKGTTTDIKGIYSIKARSGDKLIFSFLGKKNEEVLYSSQTALNVTLTDDAAKLDDVVVVGYGTQRKASVTAAVTKIDGSELLKAPVQAISNALAGRVGGVISIQTSGQPGLDAAALSVRGDKPVAIVDGLPRDINEIDPNEIESISILKDASGAAIFGLDANAVIIVTTKKGKIDDAKITYRGSYGLSTNTSMIDMLDGPGYAYWYNQARLLDGDSEVFTQSMVESMLNGENGWGNTNWYKKVFGTGTNMSHNVTVNGGSEKVKYFVSLSNFDQKGNVDNFTYNRSNFRTNLEIKLAKNLTATIGLNGILELRKRPGYSANPNDWNNVGQQAIRAHPYVPTKILNEADGKYYPVSTNTASTWVSPIAAYDQTGYKKERITTIQTNFALKYDFPQVKGLSIGFLGSYDSRTNIAKSFSTPYKTMVANIVGNQIKYNFAEYDSRGENAVLGESATPEYKFVTQSTVNYENTFGKHKVKALAIMETKDINGNWMYAKGVGFDFYEIPELKLANIANKTEIDGNSTHDRLVGFAGRINYEFDNRYLLEVSMRYDGSSMYSAKDGKKWVLLPAASVGWRISEEKWFNVDWIQNLKLRGSHGLTANSGPVKPHNYMYLMKIEQNSLVIGEKGQGMIYSNVIGNPKLTWQKNRQSNVGFDFTLWNGLLSGEFDIFYKYEYDLITTASLAIPPSMGGYRPSLTNGNKRDTKGWEFMLDHNHKIGKFHYGIKLTGTYAYRRWLKVCGESPNTPDYLKRTGKQDGALKGFIATGLFRDQDEIDNSALIPDKGVRIGDIRYLDRNGDGKITYEQDMGYVGKSPTPKFIGGLAINGEWKGIDFNMLFVCGLGRDVALTGVYTATGSEGVMDNTSLTRPFYHGGNSPKYLVEKSWTPDNPNGEFPRLSIEPASSNNAFSSTFWYRNGNYMRLKSAQIGYTFPKKWMAKAGIDKLRIYADGSNLFTISKLNKYHIDPEQPSVNNGYYPQQRVFMFGVDLTF